MRIGLAAIVLLALAVGNARAEGFDPGALYRRAEAVVQSLLGKSASDREVIKAPADIDRQMALTPPAGGTMRLIEPSPPFRQR